jgi:phosphate transport system permease protein
MPAAAPQQRTVGWMGIRRGHRARPLEWIVERAIFGVALSAILLVLLIFVFVGREALPIVLGRVDTSAVQAVIPAADLDRLPRETIRKYLGLSKADFLAKDHDTLKLLMEVREEATREASTDKDATVNTVSWPFLLAPHQWSGYEKPSYIWQPVSGIPKYNVVPLLIGSLKATVVAMLFAVPLSLAAAIYLSQLAGARVREWTKPVIEMLAGIPSVVLGSFALLVFAPAFKSFFGLESLLNATVAGLCLGLACIPVVFSIAEDALTSVPRSYTQAALALGASRWQAAWQVVLPAGLPGVCAAVVLGFGRALGETMVVLIASGMASNVSWSLMDSVRTLTATIAAELGETPFGGAHYRMLFLLGALLFAVTFILNFAADVILHRLKRRLEGNR